MALETEWGGFIVRQLKTGIEFRLGYLVAWTA
jgi:hypothetical protein